MNIDLALDLMGGMFRVGLDVLTPLLLATLCVGLLVSIIQVVTQIQEMTLTFIPKIFVVCGVLYFLGHWMLNSIMSFTVKLIKQIAFF